MKKEDDSKELSKWSDGRNWKIA